MSSHNDPVKPIPFDAVQPTPSPVPPSAPVADDSRQGTPVWVYPALAGLLVLAVVVLVWLPASLEPAQQEPAALTADPVASTDSGQPDGTAAKASPATVDKAPWSDAQAARLRREAQEKAAELLDLQFALREKGAERWASEAFAGVETLAAEGDARYKEGQYEDATALYQQGVTRLLALQENLPKELQRLLSVALQAIESGDADAARAALEQAALIDPENGDIAGLLRRAEVLPELLALLRDAANAVAGDDLGQARQLLQQATALDPANKQAAAELERITQLVNTRDFNKAMSEGYAALNEGRFDAARASFRKASTLRKDSAEAVSALQEVATAESARRLATLEQRGRSLEQQEQWQEAVKIYEQALKTDSTVLFARDGLDRSRGRAQLARQFSEVIDEPGRLADTAVANAAAQLLEQAGKITPRGPVLEQQIRQLDTLLAQANATVSVLLRSDGETDVTVYKVARLGRFTERELSLRPGTYTALGTRDGYRDIRRSFTIAHDSDTAPVTIACTEPI